MRGELKVIPASCVVLEITKYPGAAHEEKYGRQCRRFEIPAPVTRVHLRIFKSKTGHQPASLGGRFGPVGTVAALTMSTLLQASGPVSSMLSWGCCRWQVLVAIGRFRRMRCLGQLRGAYRTAEMVFYHGMRCERSLASPPCLQILGQCCE